jgi:hypothetical protein
MIQLDAGNVLLKPSHRKQLMAGLRRAMKLGQRLGHFVLNLSLHRSGKHFDVRASVSDNAGSFECHARNQDWRTAVREIVRMLVVRLHSQLTLKAAAA